MSVRAKLKLTSVKDFGGGSKEYVFNPVCNDSTPENESFTKWTPNGEFKLTVNNPAVHSKFEVGNYYYFDATPCPEEVKPA